MKARLFIGISMLSTTVTSIHAILGIGNTCVRVAGYSSLMLLLQKVMTNTDVNIVSKQNEIVNLTILLALDLKIIMPELFANIIQQHL